MYFPMYLHLFLSDPADPILLH